ncbi:P-II family nitrogen regulator [Thiomicrorhabdus sediminis]|uniref:Transcriptional regulator n=1 Tax=Thiomicrorhabdus sediminis TaxID=2580412 RepID=A0A4P9K784_9GAMM|nr:transcriptional regulator [Thiomicrorhabdus sediminis]QCU90889.1 transcriptional regulator [Thiomicrorhabdus sediminis]
MKPVKRVEFIIDSLMVETLLESLSEINITSYTVIREAYGSGERGVRGGDIFSGAFDNSYVLIACTEDESKQIIETVRPVLKNLGGMCLVSDAQWVLH